MEDDKEPWQPRLKSRKIKTMLIAIVLSEESCIYQSYIQIRVLPSRTPFEVFDTPGSPRFDYELSISRQRVDVLSIDCLWVLVIKRNPIVSHSRIALTTLLTTSFFSPKCRVRSKSSISKKLKTFELLQPAYYQGNN